jgi:hypothetical protein
MKAIKVTQELKDKNADFFANNTVNKIVAKNVPINFHGVENQNAGNYISRTDLQELDGWKDIVQPTLTDTQKRGQLIDNPNDGGVTATYEVIDLTQEEIQQRLISQSESNKQQLVQAKLETQVIEEAQTVTDEEALEQIDLYPYWSGNAVYYNLDYKVLDFNIDNELALYKVVQAHTSQADWKPKDVPALFTRVQLGDVILDWVQPTGAQDAYKLGDKVIYPSGSGQVWENTGSDANVWEPGVFGWTQI